MFVGVCMAGLVGARGYRNRSQGAGHRTRSSGSGPSLSQHCYGCSYSQESPGSALLLRKDARRADRLGEQLVNNRTQAQSREWLSYIRTCSACFFFPKVVASPAS